MLANTIYEEFLKGLTAWVLTLPDVKTLEAAEVSARTSLEDTWGFPTTLIDAEKFITSRSPSHRLAALRCLTWFEQEKNDKSLFSYLHSANVTEFIKRIRAALDTSPQPHLKLVD